MTPSTTTSVQPGSLKTASPTAETIGVRLAADLAYLPDVVAVGVSRTQDGFQVSTVVREHDLDLWDEVFECEAALYDVFPDLRAEFSVMEQCDPRAAAILTQPTVVST